MAWTEIPSRRTLYGKHYQKGDLRRYETVLDTPLAYNDGGTLAHVDLRAQRVTNAQLDGWLVTANDWHYALGIPAAHPGEDGWVGFGGKQGAYWALFRLVGAGHLHWPTRDYEILATATYDRANLSREDHALPLAEGDDQIYASSSATWASVMPGTDISWHLSGGKLKEDIHVSTAARAALESPATPDNETYAAMIFELDTVGIPIWSVAGLPKDIEQGFDDTEGAIEQRSEFTELISFMPIDYCYLANPPAPPELPTKLRLRKRIFSRDGKHWLIVGVRVDELKGLPAGDIIFDPTFETQPAAAAGKDSSIRQDNPTVNYGNSDPLYMHDTNNNLHRTGLIEFDLSSLSGSYTCDSATLYLTSVNGYAWDTNETITVYSLASGVADWTEAGVTWENYKSGTAWPGSDGGKTAGTDYETTAIGSALGPGTDQQQSISLTAARVEGWFGSSNTNYGMRLDYENNWGAVRSSDQATASLRPKLVVQYTESAPDPTQAAAEALPMGGTAAEAAAAVGAADVLIASIPPIALKTKGNLFLNTQGGQVSAMLLMTDGAKWVLCDSAGDPSTHKFCVVRKRAYLVPQ